MTILSKLPIFETENSEETQPFLNEEVVKNVLFSEQKKIAPKPTQHYIDTKKYLKNLIYEAFNEME